MANILNQFARAVLTMNGLPAAEVTRRARELKRGEKPQKPLPKAKVGKPPSAAKPPAPTPATKSPASPLTRSSAPSGRRTRVQGRVVPGGRAPSTNVDKPAPKPPAARATTTPARVSSTQPAAPAPRWTDSSNRPPASKPTTVPARASNTQLAAPAPRWTDSTTRPPAPKPPSGPVRGSIRGVSGPATSPKAPAPKPPKGSGPVRPSIGTVAGRATSPTPTNPWGQGTKPPTASTPTTTSSRALPAGKVPTPATKPGEPINVRGQTNLFGKNGQPRDFRNPKVSANRQPTVTPVSTRSGAPATPPNSRPSRVSPGQLETRSQVGVGKGKPVRGSMGKVGGPASSPKPPGSNGRGTGPVRPSIGKVSGPATSPKAPVGDAPATKPPSTNSRTAALKNERWSYKSTTPYADHILPNSTRAGGNLPRRGAAALRSPRVVNNIEHPVTGGGASATKVINRGAGATGLRGAAGAALGAAGSALGAWGATDMLIGGSNMLLDKLKGAGIAYDPKKDSRVSPRPQQGDYQSRFAGARDAAFADAKQINPTSPSKPAKPSRDTNPPSTTSRAPAAAPRPQSGGSGNTQRGAGTSAAPSRSRVSSSVARTSSAPATSRPTSRPSSAPAPQPAAPKPTYQSPAQPTSAIKTPSGSQQDGTGDYKGPETPASRKTVKAVERPSRGPTGRDEMVQYNIDRAKRKRS